MPQWIEFDTHADRRGVLTVAEKALPFMPQRLFWITNADGQQRGGHGHVETHLVLVAVTGRITVTIHRPDGRVPFVLESPARGLHLFPEDWHTLEFSPGASLLAIASHPYDAADYITTPPAPL